MRPQIAILIGLLLSRLSLGAGKEIKVSVNGMVCAFCAQGITKKLKAEPAVEKVDVRLSNRLVTITLRDSQDISDQRLKEILQNSGYNVEKIQRD